MGSSAKWRSCLAPDGVNVFLTDPAPISPRTRFTTVAGWMRASIAGDSICKNADAATVRFSCLSCICFCSEIGLVTLIRLALRPCLHALITPLIIVGVALFLMCPSQGPSCPCPCTFF
ncbi:hypothetical protein EDB83DRAFT_1067036 [Lactarius deliciosus]|nr:hypothetical protein EDB83DRAFT_1067036 [Lactarius deliciosus]